jgi:ABC-type lipoprotein release transport system permease subunit
LACFAVALVEWFRAWMLTLKGEQSLLERLISNELVFHWLEWTVVAFVFAVVVCIIFGLYRARKAAKLDPVEALGYE